MRCHNKQKIHLEDLSQACGDPYTHNEDLDIVDEKTECGNDVLSIDMESFSSSIQSNLNNNPLCYYGDSYRTN